MNNISIIIPTYKEKDNIFKLTQMILSILPKATIYIVDDTKNLSLKRYFKNKRIKYFLRKNKKGRGSAVLYGLNKSLQKKMDGYTVTKIIGYTSPPDLLKGGAFFAIAHKPGHPKETRVFRWSFL